MSASARPSRRSLHGMLFASGVSIAGTRVATIALPWLVLTETRSAAYAGLVLTAEMAPYVLSKALGGPLVDRYGPRRISVLGDLASGAFLGLIPILYAVGQLSLPDRLPLLLALVALAGAVRGPGDGARNAMIPGVAETVGMPVERITGLDSTIDRASGLLGAGVGGLLVSGFGAAQTVTVTAVASFVSAGVVATMVPALRATHGEDRGTYLTQLRAGVDFLRGDSLLRSILGMIAVTNLLEAAYIGVMLPKWALDNGYDASLVGLVGVLYGGSAVAASVVATTMAGRFSRRTAFLTGFALSGAPRYLALALGAPLWVILAANVVAGLGAGFVNPTVSALFFERVPRHLVGRVGSLADAVAWAGLPVGGVVGGLAVTALGAAPALGVAGTAYLVSTVVPGLRPEWREMDRPRTGVGRE